MIKVCFFTLVPSPHQLMLLEALAALENIELTVVYEIDKSDKRDWACFQPGNCKKIVLNSKKLYGMSCLWDIDIKRTLKTLDSDIYIIGTSGFSVNTYLIRNFALRNCIPYLLWGECPSLNTSNRMWLFLRRFLGQIRFSKTSGYIGVTFKTCEICKQEYGFSGPFSVASYHSDLSELYAVNHNLRNTGKLNILFLGELCKRKRVDTLLDALKYVEHKCRLMVVGSGKEFDMLNRKARELTNHEVKFYGRVDYSEIRSVLEKADCLVIPSDDDGFAMVVPEALAAGIPVISSDKVMAGIEFIKDGYNGWIFPSGDYISLANKISYLCANQDILPVMSVQSRKSLENYNPEISSQNIKAMIEFVLYNKYSLLLFDL